MPRKREYPSNAARQAASMTQSSASTERRKGAVGLPRDGMGSAAPDLWTLGMLNKEFADYRSQL